MTANQIRFQEHKETNRHNLVTEDLGRKTLRETIRHNKVGEQETGRHNVVVEDESMRHNIATELLTAASTAVQNAHYVRMDAENVRHNIANENITSSYNTGVLSNQHAANQIQRVNVMGNLDLKGQELDLKEKETAVRIEDLKSSIRSRNLHNVLDTVGTISHSAYEGTAATKNVVQSLTSLTNTFGAFFGMKAIPN